MLVIEKGVPMPDAWTSPKPASSKVPVYPFKEMEIGDSFFVPCVDTLRSRNNVGSKAGRSGIKVSIRTVEGGIRVWRVA